MIILRQRNYSEKKNNLTEEEKEELLAKYIQESKEESLKKRKQRGKKGAKIGSIIGGIAGLGAGHAVASEEDGNLRKAGIVAGLGTLGSATGAGLGYLAGRHNVYIIP